jgi:hypothetical protein
MMGQQQGERGRANRPRFPIPLVRCPSLWQVRRMVAEGRMEATCGCRLVEGQEVCLTHTGHPSWARQYGISSK